MVRQTETAAIKAAGDSKSTPFERKLTGLYTKATLIGDDIEASDDTDGSDQMSASHFLLCINEQVSMDDTVSFAVVVSFFMFIFIFLKTIF